MSAVAVVVPAHDEEALLGRCLLSVAAAVAELPEAVEAYVVVALDRCRDGSAAIAARHGAHRVALEAGSVGAARRAGSAAAGRLVAHHDPDRVWLAGTDADTVVPPTWLTTQLAAAAGGADLVLGRALPDPLDVSAAVLAEWEVRHVPLAAVPLHGANLGVRLSSYLAAGGWPDLAHNEDAGLVDALRRRGAVEAIGDPVRTSGRSQGRVAGGFSGYLRRLAAQLADASPPTRR